MANLLRSVALWALLAAMTGFWIVAFFAPPHSTIELLRIVQTTVSVVVAVSFFPPTWRGLLARRPEPTEQISMGIFLIFATTAMNGLWFLVWRLAGQPVWMLNGWTAELLIFLTILSAVMHILTPGAVGGNPKRARIWLGVGIGSGVLAFLVLLWLAPDIGPYVEILRGREP